MSRAAPQPLAIHGLDWQQALLEACGCDQLQGWVFSADLPEAALPDFLGQQARRDA